MEIKRRLSMTVATKRSFTIRQTRSENRILCEICNEPMLTAEQAAVYFRINQRSIFQIIEADALHFTETETSSMMICPASLAIAIEGNKSQDQPQLPE